MKHLFLKTALLLFFTITLSCINKDDPKDQLPPITQTGANTFGCIIDGKILIPKNSTGYPNAKGFIAGFSNNNFIINVHNYGDTNSNGNIYIYIYNLTSIGTYPLGTSEGLTTFYFTPNHSHVWCRTYNDTEEIFYKYLSNQNSGSITITRFDNDIISGTFNNLQMVNKENSNDTIEITEGRFDINLNTLNN